MNLLSVVSARLQEGCLALQAAAAGDKRLLREVNASLRAQISENRKQLEMSSEFLATAQKALIAEEKVSDATVDALKTRLQEERKARAMLLEKREVEAKSQEAVIAKAVAEQAAAAEREKAAALAALEEKRSLMEKESAGLRRQVTEALENGKREEMRRRIVTQEFQELRDAISKESQAYEKRLASLAEDVAKLEEEIDVRKIRTAKDRVQSLSLYEEEVRRSLLEAWTARLREAREKGKQRVEDEKKAALERYSKVVETLGMRYATEYQNIVKNLEEKSRAADHEAATLEAEVKAAVAEEKDAKARLQKVREDLAVAKEEESKRTEEETARYKQAEDRIKQLWSRDGNVDDDEKVTFLLRLEDILPCNAELERRYENYVKQLQSSLPIVSNMRARDELLTRLELVRTYIANPLQTIDEGGTDFLRQVGFTIPVPRTRTIRKSARQARREAAERRVAMHSLRMEYSECARELSRINTEMLAQLQNFQEQFGLPYRHGGKNSPPYESIIRNGQLAGEENPDLDTSEWFVEG
eukprot:g4153.t1